jgi:uncharacterized membrane protein YcaP (DUF421 family)
LGAAILVLLNSLVVRGAGRSKRAIALFEGTPTVLVTDGRYDTRALRHEGLRKADVDLAMRKQGANSVGEVERAVLEPGGSIIVELRRDAQMASHQDVDQLLGALRELDAKVSALSAAR